MRRSAKRRTLFLAAVLGLFVLALPMIATADGDVLELGGADDLVAGLVLSAPHRVDRLVVGGEDVVRGGALVRADEATIAREHRAQARRFVP